MKGEVSYSVADRIKTLQMNMDGDDYLQRYTYWVSTSGRIAIHSQRERYPPGIFMETQETLGEVPPISY
jgi:hypothetical protein